MKMSEINDLALGEDPKDAMDNTSPENTHQSSMKVEPNHDQAIANQFGN